MIINPHIKTKNSEEILQFQTKPYIKVDELKSLNLPIHMV